MLLPSGLRYRLRRDAGVAWRGGSIGPRRRRDHAEPPCLRGMV